MEIGVAHSASLRFDQDLARTRDGDVPLLKYQGLSKLFDDGGVHLMSHDWFLCCGLDDRDDPSWVNGLLQFDSFPLPYKTSRGGGAEAPDGLDHLDQHGLGVAINHVAVGLIKKAVDDARIAFALAALDHIDLFGLVGVEDRHPVDRR